MSSVLPAPAAPAPSLLDELRDAGQEDVAEVLGALAVEFAHGGAPATAHALLRTADVLAPGAADVPAALGALQDHQCAGLLGRLLHEVMLRSFLPDLDDNVDELRFPGGMPAVPTEAFPPRLARVVARLDEYERLYAQLDERSAATMLNVLAYRVLGHRKVRVMPSAGELTQAARSIESSCLRERATGSAGAFGADLFDLTPLGFPLRLHSMLLAVMGTYVLEQYRWDGVPEVGVRPGDVVIDGGGCLGDTALYFSHLAGPQGRVHVFEFEPGNVGTLRANLELNPELATRIDVVEQPLWHRSGETMRFDSAGPSTRLGAGTQVVETAAIDALVAAGRIDRVDFLKLDIEGAELQALEGARETITRFRPRLALSVYHREDDLIRIPAFVEELGLGYRFALGHYTAHAEETILFAWTDEA